MTYRRDTQLATPGLFVCKNHLALRLSPGPWLVDTGSGVSFGEAPVLHLSEVIHRVKPSHGNMGVQRLSKLTNERRVGLIGNDILGLYDIVFRLGDGHGGVAEFHQRLPREKPGKRVDISLIEGRNVPTVMTAVEGLGDRRMIFATGSQYSYLASLAGLDAHPIGKGKDFLPSCGTFAVDLYEVTVKLGSITASLKFAHHPKVSKALKTMKADGIIGWEILKHGPALYSLANRELWI